MADGPPSARLRFARQVHNQLLTKGKSTHDLAAATNISLQRLSQILRGQAVRITLFEMIAIAAALDTPLADLLDT